MNATLFSDERSMLIKKFRKSGIVAFDEVSEIIRWISDEVGFRKIGGELASDERYWEVVSGLSIGANLRPLTLC